MGGGTFIFFLPDLFNISQQLRSSDVKQEKFGYLSRYRNALAAGAFKDKALF